VALAKEKPRGWQVGPVGPTCQASQPGPTWKWPLLSLTASNRPLQHISTIVSGRFDPKATVHPTGLYKQGQTSPLRHLHLH
jgi:hypothetical protein